MDRDKVPAIARLRDNATPAQETSVSMCFKCGTPLQPSEGLRVRYLGMLLKRCAPSCKKVS
jgi:hypothetical protein